MATRDSSGKETSTFITWRGMLNRCRNRKATYYYLYGGRGIKVCARWKSFKNFLADMGKRPAGTTLDRIDNNGHYEPGNCRWTDSSTQVRNQRRTLYFTLNGVTKSIFDWSQERNIRVHTLRQRRKRGWPDEKILTTPLLSFEEIGRLGRAANKAKKLVHRRCTLA